MAAVAEAKEADSRLAEDAREKDFGGRPPELPAPVQSDGGKRRPRVLVWAVLILILGLLAGTAGGYFLRTPEVTDLQDQIAALESQQETLEADTETAQANEQAMAEQVTACEDAITTGYLIMANRSELSALLWTFGTDESATTEDEFFEQFLDSEMEFEGLMATYEDDASSCLESPSA